MTSGPRGPSRLKKLAKIVPSEQEMHNILHALALEGSPFADYAIAIIGASYLERAIEISMKGRFVDLTDEEEKRLFNYEFQGPLADFSARIKVGFAMYLFGAETRDDLEIIRRIRNVFAHQSAVLTFTLSEIEDACRSLLIIKKMSPTERGEAKDARGYYIAACTAIAHRIQMGVIRRTTKWDPSWMWPPKPPHDIP